MALIYILSKPFISFQGKTKGLTDNLSVDIQHKKVKHIYGKEFLICLVNQNGILWRTAKIQGFV